MLMKLTMIVITSKSSLHLGLLKILENFLKLFNSAWTLLKERKMILLRVVLTGGSSH